MMRKSILAVTLAAALGAVVVPSGLIAQSKGVALATNAPERHVVVSGDTLWGIAAKFLKDPHQWPAVWGMNKDTVKNPHRIYPGDVIVLDRTPDGPRLRMATVKVTPKVRSAQDGLAIPSIPASIIEPFLAQPLAVEEGGMANAPKIVAAQEGRVYMGTCDLAYVRGNVPDNVKTWQVYRPGKAFVDPDTKQTLGYEAFYLGTAKVERKTDPVTFRILDAKQEIGNGDRLIPAAAPQVINYAPRAPSSAINAKVLSSYGGVNEVGRNYIVTLSKGKADGVEMGHVLALHSYGQTVKEGRQIFERTNDPLLIKLPDERNGLAFVFRVFDRVSYALVMSAEQPVKIGDVAKTPN
jgi:hypothetical protein